MDQSLLQRLIDRGDHVSIKLGRLRIVPASGQRAPKEWLQAHTEEIELQVLSAVGIDAFRFETYGTGMYGPSRAGGATLQFRGVLTDLEAYGVFNANLKYQRGARKGGKLPKRHFSVGQRSHFVRFWKRAGLSMPTSLTRFHQHMGNLRPILFTGNIVGGRFEVASLAPLELSNSKILRATMTHSAHISDPQLTHNSPIKSTHTDFPESQLQRGLPPDQTTCPSKYVNKEIREYGSRDNSSSSRKDPRDQTVDEWFGDYDNAPSENEVMP